MALPKKIRGTTFKHQIEFKSGSSLVDCSGNMLTFNFYEPDGILKMSVSGTHRSTGLYDAYFSTQTTDDLGIWILESKGYFSYRTTYPWGPKRTRDEIEISHVD